MKFIIAGLGNMDPDYMETRHNIGFDVLDVLAARFKLEWVSSRYAHSTELKYRGRQILLIKPTTYMNLSGKAVRYWAQTMQVPLENLLVVLDDLNLDFGKLRLKGEGSDGGHNGLKDITAQMGTTKYARLRIGIGRDFMKGAQVHFVLGRWTEEERSALAPVMDRAAEACLDFCTAGLQNSMNKHNSFKPEQPEGPGK